MASADATDPGDRLARIEKKVEAVLDLLGNSPPTDPDRNPYFKTEVSKSGRNVIVSWDNRFWSAFFWAAWSRASAWKKTILTGGVAGFGSVVIACWEFIKPAISAYLRRKGILP